MTIDRLPLELWYEVLGHAVPSYSTHGEYLERQRFLTRVVSLVHPSWTRFAQDRLVTRVWFNGDDHNLVTRVRQLVNTLRRQQQRPIKTTTRELRLDGSLDVLTSATKHDDHDLCWNRLISLEHVNYEEREPMSRYALFTKLEQLTIRTTLELDVKRGDDDDDVGSGFPNLTRLALDLSNVDGSVSIEPYSNAFWTRPETTCPRLEHLSLSLDLSPVDCRLVADAWGRTLRSSTLTNRLKVLDLARSNHSQFVIESLLVDRSDDSTFRRFENLRHLSIESPVRLSNRARRKRPPPPPLGGEWSKFLYDAAGINLDSLDLYLDPLSSDPNDADYYEDDDDDDSEDYHRGGQEDEELEECPATTTSPCSSRNESACMA
ncbi:hypothetical protein JCM3766R1_004845 [Sporobolomyces carnicolor]